jgi:alpha-glucosidase (family GH31 glycosyl hydrolase)
LGSHRYPIGFSGDTYGTYGSLAFQPYFTATASNVRFGYWGHDIGGHLQLGDPNPELMLRWLQFGVFSPIFRTHGASQWNNERRIWKYSNFPLMLDACNLRYQLMPYIYTAVRQAYDTGVSICRPLYYEWPEENEAYRQEGEYMFGDDILVSPVVTEAETDGKAFRKTWLPEGKWFDVCRNRLLEGNQTIADYYDQNEIPYFIKAGSVIPCNPKIRNLKTRADSLVLKVIPGASGSTSYYEDEGDTQAYADGAFTTTAISQERTADYVAFAIAPREGQFEGMPTQRPYRVEFLGEESKPELVQLNGAETTDWTYNAEKKLLTVIVPKTDCGSRISIHVIRSLTGIQSAAASTMSRQQSFDLQGRSLQQGKKGVRIVRSTWADGTVTTHKVLR